MDQAKYRREKHNTLRNRNRQPYAGDPPKLRQQQDSAGQQNKGTENESAADTFPFESAVNIADVKILNPQNRKLYEKIENPFTAI